MVENSYNKKIHLYVSRQEEGNHDIFVRNKVHWHFYFKSCDEVTGCPQLSLPELQAQVRYAFRNLTKRNMKRDTTLGESGFSSKQAANNALCQPRLWSYFQSETGSSKGFQSPWYQKSLISHSDTHTQVARLVSYTFYTVHS